MLLQKVTGVVISQGITSSDSAKGLKKTSNLCLSDIISCKNPVKKSVSRILQVVNKWFKGKFYIDGSELSYGSDGIYRRPGKIFPFVGVTVDVKPNGISFYRYNNGKPVCHLYRANNGGFSLTYGEKSIYYKPEAETLTMSRIVNRQSGIGVYTYTIKVNGNEKAIKTKNFHKL